MSTNELLWWTAANGTVLAFQSPFILQDMAGAGSGPADVQLQKAPFQDGQTLIDQLLKERTLSLTVMIVGTSRQDMLDKRRQAARAFNPKLGQGTFTWQDIAGVQWQLDAVPEGCEFPGGEAAGVVYQQAVITLIAANPFWYVPGTLDVSLLTGGMVFPVSFPSGFATIVPASNATNDGDVETPIDFTFIGPCLNPKVANLTTGKSIQVNYNVASGYSIYVNTAFGAKEVSLVAPGGTKTNIMNYLTVTSEFFMLQPGANSLQYSESGGNVNPMMLVNWRNRYAER